MDKPWENEPDLVQFESHGFPCVIRRVEGLGHLCGYIGVPKELEQDYYDEFEPKVHGGWTYIEDRFPGAEPDGRYWYGFDCAHSGDLVPKYAESGNILGTGTYRTVDFVRGELERVAGEVAKKMEYFITKEAVLKELEPEHDSIHDLWRERQGRPLP